MRIAYVIPAWPPLASQPFVVNEMLAVQRAGHELVVLPLYPNRDQRIRHGTFTQLRPVCVLPAPLVDLRSVLLALVVSARRPLRTLPPIAGLHRTAGCAAWAHVRLLAVTPKAVAAAWRLQRLGVQHVHAHFANQTADCAAIVASVAGLPFSLTAHAYDIYSTAPGLRNATLRWKLEHAARVFAVSNFARDLLRGELPAGERERVQTSYVGIPLALFRYVPPPADTDGLRLLSIARFQEKKGLDTLLDACARLRDREVAFSLRIFGDGPLRPHLAAQCLRLALHDRVMLGEPIAQERVAEEMRAAHVFVLPCRRDRHGDMDGIPTVFMEALATGRPVVSCAVSGIPELVRDGETGALVPPDDPDALADAIAWLARERAVREQLGRQGRALVEQQHDAERNARQLVTALAELHAVLARDGTPGTRGRARRQ